MTNQLSIPLPEHVLDAVDAHLLYVQDGILTLVPSIRLDAEECHAALAPEAFADLTAAFDEAIAVTKHFAPLRDTRNVNRDSLLGQANRAAADAVDELIDSYWYDATNAYLSVLKGEDR
ncbi:MAG: hypothetical protein KDB26_14740 [Microthrixaceae bacterium]|nr:hypothetical protein [Microthrixaceae bacterium]